MSDASWGRCAAPLRVCLNAISTNSSGALHPNFLYEKLLGILFPIFSIVKTVHLEYFPKSRLLQIGDVFSTHNLIGPTDAGGYERIRFDLPDVSSAGVCCGFGCAVVVNGLSGARYGGQAADAPQNMRQTGSRRPSIYYILMMSQCTAKNNSTPKNIRRA
jgi:hypothetical protein